MFHYPFRGAREMDSETLWNETWSVTFTPDAEGFHDCVLKVMNSRNQLSQATVSFTIVSGEVNLTPGFEFLILLVVLVVIPMNRRLRRK
jgi:ABC-type methionine transport system permease subunit